MVFEPLKEQVWIIAGEKERAVVRDDICKGEQIDRGVHVDGESISHVHRCGLALWSKLMVRICTRVGPINDDEFFAGIGKLH